MMRILVIGAKGNLGQELVNVFSAESRYEVSAWDREEVDVTDVATVSRRVAELRPEIILNAVAYNAVDACETDDEAYGVARILNVDLPAALAHVAKALDARLVHYSTDYVFGASDENAVLQGGFAEDDEPHPACRYAETKYAGERAVLDTWERSYVVRLSKLFGMQGTSEFSKKSFFDVMLGAAVSQSEVKVVDGEKSCFTFAPDLAQATKELLEDGAEFGVYHLVNEGSVTWYEAAGELYRQAGVTIRVVPVDSSEFPRPAKRPEFSALRNTRRPLLRPWQEALGAWLQNREK